MTNSESCTVWLPKEFQGFTSRINSKGYHSLVPGLISIFLERVWVPLIIPNFSSIATLFTTKLITKRSTLHTTKACRPLITNF